MAKKYECTGEEKGFYGRILKRIRAVRDFGDVKAGELGGWIKSEKNLSHDGFCWVKDHATVMRDAVVEENAVISGNAAVWGTSKIKGNAVVKDNAIVGGNACIKGNAIVKENARVGGNACIKENAIVKGNDRVHRFAFIRSSADIFTVSHVGNKNERLTAYRMKDSGVYVVQDYFTGTLDEFTEDVYQEHGNSNIGKEYQTLIECLKNRFSIEDVA